MADTRDDSDFYLVDPPRRGVLPLQAFHVSRRLARTIRSGKFEVTYDQDFDAVIEGCAAAAPDRLQSWISRPIQRLYRELFDQGLVHSLEAHLDGQLVGGLYGVSLGGAFFGESMFSRRRDASKVALAHLAARLRVGGYLLLDTQFMTDHLAGFGAAEIDRIDYLARLQLALTQNADFCRFADHADGTAVLQAINQAS